MTCSSDEITTTGNVHATGVEQPALTATLLITISQRYMGTHFTTVKTVTHEEQ